tara:strand:- start:5176 stop:7140 length:1965 start_codon:yes stop_codon:yes gene_type:complete
MWLLAYYYLQGARRFDVFDPQFGKLSPNFLDENGNLEYQSQELISAIDKVSSKLAELDVSPAVKQRGTTLSGLRERSVAQILLDSTLSANQLQDIKSKFCYMFTALGCCGITGHITEHESIGLVNDLEVIHPRELMPFPSVGEDYTKAYGLMRQRVVPLEVLVQKYGSKIKKNIHNMEYWTDQIGNQMHDPFSEENLGSGIGYNRVNYVNSDKLASTSNSGGSLSGEPDTHHTLVRIREVWIDGPAGTVDRYIISSGDYVIADEDYSGIEVYCPIGFARFMENGTFHGMGMFDLLFGISREMEKLLKNLFNNVRDMDKYGVLVLPQGQFNERALLRDIGDGLKVLPFEPDPVSENFRPFPITPVNMGDQPGKVAAMAKSMLDNLNPIRDLISQKGRVDSASGLNYLDEKINEAISTPTRGLERAFSDCYRASLGSIIKNVIESPQSIRIEKLSLDLAGVIFDPEDNTISFEQANPIPTLQDLTFSIAQKEPKSAAAIKSEALEMIKAGIMDQQAFKIFMIQQGVRIAAYLDEERNAYESVVRNSLILYGNGTSPGQIVVTPHTASPKMQLRVLTGFMSSPRMAIASPEVQNAFKRYREFLMDSLGMVLPEAVPNPDDLAALQGTMEQMNVGANRAIGLPPAGPIGFPGGIPAAG